MKNHLCNKKVLCTAIAAALGVSPLNAAVLEEMVVTAQKREENLQDVGMSVTAMSGLQTEALGINNTVQISQQVPGLQVQTFSPAFTIFNLRGISQNNFQDNLEAPVAAYFDDVYVGSMNAIGGQMFDMQRTEVLRGPQGTLFGRNATGGLIHFVTRKAIEDELNGYVRVGASEFNTFNFEGAVGGALSDTVRGRVAARIENSDGYLEPGPILPGALGVGSPAIGGGGSPSNGSDAMSIRGNLQIDASANTTIELTAAYSEDNDAPIGQWLIYLTGLDANGLGTEIGAPLTGDVHKHAGTNFSAGGLDTGLDREMTSLTAKVSSSLSNGVEFTSITNWLDMEKSHREDGGGGLIEFGFATLADYQQLSQEIRFSGDGGTYRWQAGAYYLDMVNDSVSIVSGPTITGFAQGIIDGFANVDSTNWSVFGQLEYDFTDTLTFIAGYRWSQDDKEIDFTNIARSGMDLDGDGTDDDGAVLFDLANQAVGAFADVPYIDYGDFAARLQLNWNVNDQTLLFLSYNRGIKGGNWSPGAFVNISDFKHGEETLHSYEIGVKTTLADGLARLNATAFNYDYDDYQAFSLTNLIPQVANSDATNRGGEIELTLLPTDNWDIMLGASFIDSEIEFSPGPAGLIANTELPSAPGYSLNYLFRYNWNALDGNMALQVDGVYNDDQFMEGHNGRSSIQKAYGNTNASLNYTSGDGDWDLRFWVKNLTDAESALYSLDIGGFVIRQYAPPRWYGVTASYNW